MPQQELKKVPLFLALQTTYQRVDYGLFLGSSCLESSQLEKRDASAWLIPKLQKILDNNKVALKDIDFIVVNAGPGPFTTLRTVLAVVNGISFANHTPVIGIDGLTTLHNYHTNALTKNHSMLSKNLFILINAYNNDCYFAYADQQGSVQKGCQPIESLLEKLSKEFDGQSLAIAGNGISSFTSLISNYLPSATIIFDDQEVPLRAIAHQGLVAFNAQQNAQHISPLYLKNGLYKKSYIE